MLCNAFDDESHRIYAQRYPAIFKTFLQHTNEKEIDAAAIVNISKIIAQANPGWLRKNPTVYDIGCGEGYLTSLVLGGIHTVVPTELRYVGIDPQEKFLKKTAHAIEGMSWLKPSFQALNFEDFVVTPVQPSIADILLMCHCCYYMHDVSLCISTMKQLLSAQGYAFLVHVDDSVLHIFKKEHKEIFQSHSVDILSIIETALNNVGLKYRSIEVPVTFTFPKVSDKVWDDLHAVGYGNYSVDYSVFGDDFVCMKNLFEFFFEHPMEAFLPEDKKLLLEGLRKILEDAGYAITIYHRMHVVSKSDLPEQLHDIVMDKTVEIPTPLKLDRIVVYRV